MGKIDPRVTLQPAGWTPEKEESWCPSKPDPHPDKGSWYCCRECGEYYPGKAHVRTIEQSVCRACRDVLGVARMRGAHRKEHSRTARLLRWLAKAA